MLLAPLKLHYLRWLVFHDREVTLISCTKGYSTPISINTPEDAVAIFARPGISTVFENLEGFPVDWKTKSAGI